MAKLTLNNVTSGYNLATVYNANNDAIEAALENTLSRDGTAPNDMEANLDMGGHRIFNLGAPQTSTDAVRVIDIESGDITVSPDIDWANINDIPDRIQELAALTDPNADRLIFWDDSAGDLVYLSLGTGLSITGTTISATVSSVAWAGITGIPTFVTSIGALSDPNADRIVFWDDSASNLAHLTVSTGLAISGTSLSLSFLGLQSLSDPNNDRIVFWDDSAGTLQWLTVGSGLSITGTSIGLDGSLSSLAALTDPGADRIVFWDDSASNYANLEPTGHLGISGTQIAYSSTTGSFTGTLTGVTTTPTGSITYAINGGVCTLRIPVITGTANSTAHTITGGPAAMRPATAQTVLGVTTNNSVDAIGKLIVETTGVITLHNGLSAVFTGTGTEGVGLISVTYPLS